MNGPCDGGTWIARWSRHPRSVGRARLGLRKALAGWGLSGIEHSAALVLSELVTNAVRHGSAAPGRQIETRCARTPGGGLRIEVHDTGDGRPWPARPGPDAEGGRGLWLVGELADRWGVESRLGPGKYVWAELSVPPETYP
ncbi:ATP-binding protein [Streptomyces qinzhouensis]|uniref:ATP-binding protein n=1 Tax=Streptomyces qinzhouensis TaxID=2599401 RepID=A0A5B8J5M7_9ACTN|nr:ATP-binding protein [Streptomyces qinzhouensis]QDY77105.1 ATP-binding protein [Streptomyces qinzhouensis]